MRRSVLLLVSLALAVPLASGVAWAATLVGSNGPDAIRGTNRDDVIRTKAGADTNRSIDQDATYQIARLTGRLGAGGAPHAALPQRVAHHPACKVALLAFRLV